MVIMVGKVGGASATTKLLQQTAGSPASNAKPSFLQKVGKIGGDTLTFLGDNLSRANYAVANMAKTMTDKKSDSFLSVLKSGGRGFALKEKTTFSNVLDQMGVKNKYVKNIGGLALDIALDPTTYLTSGAVAGAKITAKVGKRTVTRVLTEAGTKAFKTIEARSGREIAEKTINKMIDKSPEYAAKYLDKGGLKFGRIEAFGKKISEGITVPGTAKLNDAVTEVTTKLMKKYGGAFSRDAKILDRQDFIRVQQKYRDIQAAKESNFVQKFRTDFKNIASLTDDQSKRVINAIEDGTWKELDGVELAAANEWKKVEGRTTKMLINSGIPVKKLDNYVTHIYQDQQLADGILAKKKAGVSITDPFTKQRRFKTLAEAEENGLKPVYDLAQIAQARYSSALRASVRSDFLRETAQKFGIPEKVVKVIEKDLPKNVEFNQRLAEGIVKNTADKNQVIEDLNKLSARRKELFADVSDKLSEYKNFDNFSDFRKFMAENGSQLDHTELMKLYQKNRADYKNITTILKKDIPGVQREISNTEKLLEKKTTKVFPDVKPETVNVAQKVSNPALVDVSDNLQRVSGVKELKGVLIPGDIVEYIRNMDAKFFNEEKIGNALRNYDKVQNFYKDSLTTMFPSFHVRNLISNVMQNIMDVGLIQAVNPKLHLIAHDVMNSRNLDKIVNLGNKNYSIGELKKLADDLGVLGSPGYFDVKGAVSKLNYGRRAGSYIENEARSANFIANLIRTNDPVTAAERTKKFLFDYNNISDFEKNVVKRFIPFWTWPSKNFALTAQQIVTNPGKVSAMLKAYNQGKTGEENEYLKNRFSIKLPDNKLTKFLYGDTNDKYIYGLGAPLESFSDIVSNPVKQSIQMLNPIFKGMIELSMNKDTFREKPITDLGESGTDILRIIPEGTREKLGIFTVKRTDQKTGKEYTKIRTNPYMAWAIRSLPTSRFSSLAGKISDERTTPFEKALSGLIGVNVTTSTQEQVYKALEAKYKEEAAKPLLSKGYIKKNAYGKYYLDKSVSMSEDDKMATKEIIRTLNTELVPSNKTYSGKEYKPLSKPTFKLQTGKKK